MIYPAISFTPEGGLALRMINKTGAASVKGTIVAAGTSTRGFVTTAASDVMAIGLVYDAGIADGSPCRVIVGGAGQVLMKNTVGSTVGYAAITSSTAGRADASATVATDGREIGQFMETAAGGTNVLAWVAVHFN